MRIYMEWYILWNILKLSSWWYTQFEYLHSYIHWVVYTHVRTQLVKLMIYTAWVCTLAYHSIYSLIHILKLCIQSTHTHSVHFYVHTQIVCIFLCIYKCINTCNVYIISWAKQFRAPFLSRFFLPSALYFECIYWMCVRTYSYILSMHILNVCVCVCVCVCACIHTPGARQFFAPSSWACCDLLPCFRGPAARSWPACAPAPRPPCQKRPTQDTNKRKQQKTHIIYPQNRFTKQTQKSDARKRPIKDQSVRFSQETEFLENATPSQKGPTSSKNNPLRAHILEKQLTTLPKNLPFWPWLGASRPRGFKTRVLLRNKKDPHSRKRNFTNWPNTTLFRRFVSEGYEDERGKKRGKRDKPLVWPFSGASGQMGLRTKAWLFGPLPTPLCGMCCTWIWEGGYQLMIHALACQRSLRQQMLWERSRPVSYRSIFMLRTKVRNYVARWFRTLVRSINMLR